MKHQLIFSLSTHHFDSTSFELNKIIEDNNHRQLDDFDYDFYLKNINDVDVESKSKQFLCYIRNCNRDHRKSNCFLFSTQQFME